jgi:hypothetical protein
MDRRDRVTLRPPRPLTFARRSAGSRSLKALDSHGDTSAMESAVPLVSTLTQPRVQRLAFWGGALIAGLLAVLRLLESWQRLVMPVDRFDGIDIRFRWREVHAWFSGQPVYGAFEHADYPPATHALLWPLIGWLDLQHARWLFAASTLVALIWLSWTLARESRVRSRLARFTIGLVPFASYTTIATLIVGQMTIHVVALLVGGLLLLARSKTWRDDVLGAVAVIAALAKPTLSVPLVWVAVLAPGRWRPAVLIGSGYAALTLLAARFQADGPIALFGAWLGQSKKVAAAETAANLQMLLGRIGLDELFLPLVGLVFVGTGVWVWRHRHVDVWILIGVTALVARFWTYHREFDDLSAILAAIALLRVARFGARGPADATAAALGAGLLALLVAPYGEIREAGFRWAFNLTLAGAWLAAFAHLLRAARRERSALAHASDHELAAGLAPFRPSPPAPSAAPLLLSALIACPVVVLTGAYAWLAAAHGTPWLWSEIVHENGRRSLGETILYASHFLREIPTLLAMVLFTLAAVGRPPAHVIPREWRAALLAAGGLAAIAFVVAAFELGAGTAFWHLLQDYTRDDVASFGSHWRYHFLSTLWFGAMVRVVAPVAAVYFGAPPHWQRGSVRLGRVAWLYFGVLTVVFGLSPDIATDPLHVGHQAREIATHALVTLPLVLAVLAWIDGRRDPVPAGPAPTLNWLDLAGAAGIPAYLGMVAMATNVTEAGQAGGDLAALVAAHFFEHSLDYAFVGLLVFGCYGIRSQRVAIPQS